MKNIGKNLLVIILIAAMSAATIMTTMPFASAVTNYDTFAFVMVSPNPVGVNQEALVTFRIDKTNPLTTGSITGERWHGLSVKITKPDGTIENKGPYDADPTGGSWFLYTPAQTGTYIFQCSFPGQDVNVSANDVRFYKASISASLTVTVQQDHIPRYSQSPPLPTDPWTRPIDSENKGWWQIADDWLMKGYDREEARPFAAGTAFAPYSSAPNSAHVLWTDPIYFGGMVGGKFGDASFYTGLAYEQFFNAMIQQGRLFYTVHGPSTSSDSYGTRVLDLQTGEEIAYLDGIDIAFAQNLMIDIPNEHGPMPFLWSISGSTWTMYDSFNYKPILNITNVPSGTTTFGPNGELLRYSFSGSASSRRLQMWNSTQAILGAGFTEYWSPRVGSVINGTNGIQWNVAIPNIGGSQSIKMIGENIIIAGYQVSTVYPNIYAQAAYPATIEKLSNGSYPNSINHLWAQNRTNIDDFRERIGRNIQGGVFTQYDEPTMKLYGYSALTGSQLWVTNPLPMGWGIFGTSQCVAYDKVLRAGYDGYARAYSAVNGNLLWEYYLGQPGYLENAYGVYPVQEGFTIADHKMFVTGGEHSPDAVIWRGAMLWAIDTETGECLWNITGRFRNPSVADGILVALNSMDGVAYAFGKGASATTISAPLAATTQGQSIMITGTVTDQSPAQPGTPAISDADMGRWMEYLHMQKIMPTDVKGVQVMLTAVGPNSEAITIGTAETDIAGSYGLRWTPPTEGAYQIMATFAGTNSYGSSYATTYVAVDSAPSPAPTSTMAPTEAPTPTSTPTAAPTASPSAIVGPSTGISTETLLIAGAAVVIIIAVIAAALVLRKR